MEAERDGDRPTLERREPSSHPSLHLGLLVFWVFRFQLQQYTPHLRRTTTTSTPAITPSFWAESALFKLKMWCSHSSSGSNRPRMSSSWTGFSESSPISRWKKPTPPSPAFDSRFRSGSFWTCLPKADDGYMIQGEIKKINKVASKNYYFNTIHVLFYLSFFFQHMYYFIYLFFLESMVGSF